MAPQGSQHMGRRAWTVCSPLGSTGSHVRATPNRAPEGLSEKAVQVCYLKSEGKENHASKLLCDGRVPLSESLVMKCFGCGTELLWEQVWVQRVMWEGWNVGSAVH